ncbi:unnamed protein product [Penicillium camemberti]|uniref:Str. FM013 n=1 Tax=Penicillium camemberti (strain FM 013) TaxID=1429867 RepID=A0A0G4PW58_PENC3|nr:unnamed protein product [Penicillium camemberti]
MIAPDDDLEMMDFQQIHVGPLDRWSLHMAELFAINKYSTSATILCDSISAPKGIQNSATNLTYYHAYHIYTQSPSPSQANGIALYLQWIIGHCDNPRNDATRPAMSFPPTTHKGKGAHPRQHPRSVGTGVEIIHSK